MPASTDHSFGPAWPVGHWAPHGRTNGRRSTRAEQMKNGLVPRWLFHWLRASSGITARQIVVMATRRRRPTSSRPASATSAQQQQQQQLVMVVVVMDVRDESTFSSADAHNFTDLNQTERCDRDSTRHYDAGNWPHAVSPQTATREVYWSKDLERASITVENYKVQIYEIMFDYASWSSFHKATVNLSNYTVSEKRYRLARSSSFGCFDNFDTF